MTHKLNEDPSYPPVKQKKRKQGSFENQVIQDEVKKLLKIGSIREVKYPDWSANTVVVPKKNGHELLSFLDAYSGYNQIKIDPLDEGKTSFITDKGTYCYKVIPFGLKNVGATYQRLVTKMFQEHLGKTMEVYIDDMLLSNPPLLAKPKDGEKLLVYLVVSEVAVSVVLVREDHGKQSLIYYVIQSLLDAETRYPHLEKPALALIMASRKLRPYFQCHPIFVVTAYPLRNILHKQELSGRLAKWAIELSEYDITYQPRTTIKSQVLADFVADFSQGIQLEAEKELRIFKDLIQYGILPEDKKKAQALRKKVARYCLNQGNLHRKIFDGPLARCLGPSQIEYVMREIHEGHCGNHAGRRSLEKGSKRHHQQQKARFDLKKLGHPPHQGQLRRAREYQPWEKRTLALLSFFNGLFNLC
ncbi:uncharacterized protein [Nicotiana sylvestris]|uniref:uncharacterized protein n=1 Tax=Nicotiana sylvestris TaxID=4096 RepID=UPI00388CB32A